MSYTNDYDALQSSYEHGEDYGLRRRLDASGDESAGSFATTQALTPNSTEPGLNSNMDNNEIAAYISIAIIFAVLCCKLLWKKLAKLC